MTRKHARIVQFPFAATLQGALLDSYREEQRGQGLDIILNIRALEHTASSELFERDRVIHERVRGNFVPAQIHFSGVWDLSSGDFFTNLIHLPRNDPARTINDMLSWQRRERPDTFFLFFMQAPTVDNLMFFARHITHEKLAQESTPVTLERNWSPPPPMPERLVPQPRYLYRRFGGDPITIRMNGRVHHHRLFIGGTDIQSEQHPRVDVVLNLGENPSRWVTVGFSHPNDRTANKGEGTDGMSVEEIQEEANWVIDHLQEKRSVLVHCTAGMNRSATICCAVLILLEGLSAEDALQRVREHHPWSRPDSHHWLALRWLELHRKE